MVDWRLPEGNLMDEVPMKEIVGHLSNPCLKRAVSLQAAA